VKPLAPPWKGSPGLPTFGEGSRRLGGADADLILGSTLLDVKTTKEQKAKASAVLQVVAYALLANRFGVDGAPEAREIDTVGLYFARAGAVVRFPLGACIADGDRDPVLDFLLAQGAGAGSSTP
jgi:hypothetical protein